MRTIAPFFLYFLSLTLLTTPLFAEEGPQYAKRGLLAVAGVVGHGDLQVPGAWDGPITGSVGMNGKECVLAAENHSSDRFQISVELVEFKSDRTRQSTGSHSLRLEPNERKERVVKTKNQTAGCALVLTRWKVLSK